VRGDSGDLGNPIRRELERRTLGFDEVAEVRVGKYIEIQVTAEHKREARERVEEMCRKLLANHVIEDFRFEVEEAPAEVPTG
jgi:phosphoribosylformylglycinamidine synthase